MKILNTGFKLFLPLLFVAVFISWNPGQSIAKPECSEWSKIICKQLGVMGIACGKAGVNLTARGLITDQAPLKRIGFQFGEGPYNMNATRIDTGRYLVEIQSMTRPNDHYKKEIVLKTRADTVYPVRLAPAPAGKYTWNSAIQFDLEQQLGMRPISLLKEKPRYFVDIIIVDPDKMAKAGFPGFKMNQQGSQLLYLGNNQWEFNPVGGMLVYENAAWTTDAAATASKPLPPSTNLSSPLASPSTSDTLAAEQQILLFELIEASDMSYNNSSEELLVYQSRQNGGSFYLVQNDRIGTGLIDTKQGRVYDAGSAILSADGNRMELDLDQAETITPSGVDVLEGKTKYRVEAWWDQDRLAFTIGQAEEDDQPMAFGAHDVSDSVTEETTPLDPDLLFKNSDFENGDLTNWTADGDAFEYQPTKGDNPTARRRNQPSRHQGEYWIGTFEKYNGNPELRPGQTQGDRPTGTLTSVSFVVSRDQIVFLIGGGKHSDKEYAALVVDGKEVMKTTGNRKETMHEVVWDVRKFAGKQAQIVIKDLHHSGWGHINADDFRYEGEN
ncbi:MAG: hypothetical protein K8S13_10690 [Desulfobacula sp.]|uniref:hypothetical protein n=1 Tax=Desulfobacula sp. TaxID=2593537 RepID=UPI0025BFF857|nr:hypothetical protein [Desulfobacula sp.]MCD4720306.1 hypothetical protein [Desulfobacula sp.]